MTKTTLFSILGLGVFVVLIILVAGKGNEQDTEVILEGSEEQVLIDTEGKKMSFAEFLKQDKGSYECTVSQYIDEGMSQSVAGQVFLDAGRIRGDFSVDVSGISLSASTLVLDGFVYSWTSMSPVGFKAVAQEGEADTNAEMSDSYSWNAEKIGEYDCQEWQVDETMFELPQGMTFQEV